MIPSYQKWRQWSPPSKLAAIGTFLTAAGLAVGIIQLFANGWSSNENGTHEPQRGPTSEQAEPTRPGTAEYLSDENLRGQIDKYLQTGQVRSAISLLRHFDNPDARDEECKRIFSFSLRGGFLDAAEDVVAECWKGDKKREALEEIMHEKIKQ